MSNRRTPRRFLQFRLRTLLILLTVAALPLAWANARLQQSRGEEAALRWVKSVGAALNVIYQQPGNAWESRCDHWLGKRMQTATIRVRGETDLSPLAQLSNLENLTLYLGSKPTDLSALANLKQLKTLRIHGEGVVDLSPLATLSELRKLNLTRTSVANLTPLAGLRNLKSLNLTETKVDSVTALLDLRDLERLVLTNTPLESALRIRDWKVMLNYKSPNHDLRFSPNSDADPVFSSGFTIVYPPGLGEYDKLFWDNSDTRQWDPLAGKTQDSFGTLDPQELGRQQIRMLNAALPGCTVYCEPNAYPLNMFTCLF